MWHNRTFTSAHSCSFDNFIFWSTCWGEKSCVNQFSLLMMLHSIYWQTNQCEWNAKESIRMNTNEHLNVFSTHTEKVPTYKCTRANCKQLVEYMNKNEPVFTFTNIGCCAISTDILKTGWFMLFFLPSYVILHSIRTEKCASKEIQTKVASVLVSVCMNAVDGRSI